ncbi:hypothetical protein [Sandaracinus amylolyticus]|uniref:hypothetical protein n=1 Tax=Sandaracinus amylolyticus TaxID=927083 RepID=UPI001F19F0F9|nr:hypothetical protein [Sandaracinus amylolyticus]UJR79822.1 Hypothetical protein I5071_18600 [Sandaracinus amylolyticus]
MSVRWICDTSEWPLVALDVPPGADPEQLVQSSIFDEVDALLEKGQRFATMHDVRRAGKIDALRRKRFADWVRSREAQMKKLLIAHAAVVSGELQRGAITALLWIRPPPTEMRVFTSTHDARSWLRERIAADRARR